MATTSQKWKEKKPDAISENVGGGSEPLTKGGAQVNIMVAMTRILESSSEARDNLLVARHWISNAKATSVEFSNIKQMMKVGAILQEKGKKR